MTGNDHDSAGVHSLASPGAIAGNLAEPIRFEQVETIQGFSGAAGNSDEQIPVITRLAITSDEQGFHGLAESIGRLVGTWGARLNRAVDISDSKTVLLVLRPDNSADLWLDTAAVTMTCIVTRAVVAGSPVFQNDLADIIAMQFPCVQFGEQDKVLCLIRESWGYALAFDLNPQGQLDMRSFERELATLYRRLRYRHLYQAVNNDESLDRLMAQGWFPFVEILHREFNGILGHHKGGLVLDEIEAGAVSNFDSDRLERMLSRWLAKPHFSAKEALLREGIDAFIRGKPIAAIKILVTEIEGILNGAYRASMGRSGKTKDLLAFAIESAEKRTGGTGTLFLTSEFNRYLLNYTYANFDPDSQAADAGSRHAVGHGAADSASYTMVKALQVILTLDQLAFYT